MNPSAPAPSGFGFGFEANTSSSAPPSAPPAAAAGTGDAAQTTAPAPGPQATISADQGAAPVAAEQPAPAAASQPEAPAPAKKIVKATRAQPPPVLDLMAKLRVAAAEGSLNTELGQELKARFAAPFKPPAPAVSATASPPASGSAPASTGAATAPWGFGATGATASSAAAAPPGAGLHQFSQLTTAQEKSQSSANAQHVRSATEFLNVLLMCDSGFNNIEVVTDDTLDAQSESIKGLHAVMAELAPEAAGSVVAYLSRELVPSASSGGAMAASSSDHSGAAGGEGLIARIATHTVVTATAPPVVDGSGTAAASSARGSSLLVAPSLAQSNAVLLSAQCLYLLTRHFQMQASLVKALLELVHQLLRQVRVELQGRPIEFSRFRSSNETSSLCTLLWLVVFSVVNVMAVWKKMRQSNGRLGANALLRTAVAETLDEAITAMRREFEVHATDAGAMGFDAGASSGRRGDAHTFLTSSAPDAVSGGLLGRVSASRRGADKDARLEQGAGAGQLTVDGKVVGGYGHLSHRWEVVVQAYLSILTLAEACFLRGKQDDASYEKACDKAIEAFLGDRESNPTSMCRGKAVKRMHQLMPHPTTVFVPLEILYVAPYEVLSYLFDYMLQVLHRISELEVATFARYLRQSQALEERFATTQGAAAAAGGARGNLSMGGTTTQHGGGFASRHHHYGQALRAMLPDARNYAMDGVAQHSGITAQLMPFTSEMSHILETLSVCLQHLPPEVLNPDLDTNCAATFFVFVNFTKHLGEVLKVQRSSASLWESFTHKVIARYLDVLTMIGRNPQYIERVVKLLSDTQVECPELAWGGLVNQALECTGLNRYGYGATASAAGTGASAVDNTVAATGVAWCDADEDGARHQPYRQYLPAFARTCRQNYVASFFMLMRQMFLHPELRELVRHYFTLELGLAMLHAERHSQSTLGSTLSLISALITNAEDAQKVLEHLRTEQFLAPWTAAPLTHTVPNALGSAASPRSGAGVRATEHVETRSLLGHCEYEATVGRYSITVGFLNLLIALLRYDAPGMESFEIYTSVTHFVAHKIFIGVARRSFERECERGTVTALAAAALRHALLFCFTADSTVNTIPFQTVFATVKAPTDVLGELIGVICKASARTAELTVYECAAVRQCLRLLSTAIQAPSRQQRHAVCFDARVLNSATLPFRALLLCSGRDSLLTHAVLRVLTLLPTHTMTEASHMWHAHSHYFATARANFAAMLDPQQVSGPLTYAPPELIVLDYDWGPRGSLKSLSPVAVLEENRSALLDLLIQHAPVREPSTTAWLCGFYTALPTSAGGSGARAGVDALQLDDTAILYAVLSGTGNETLAEAYPLLAVKYTRLLYELRANGLYGADTIRPLMEYFRCHGLFLELLYLRPDRCHPLLLSKYAYVLKMLSLELVFAHANTPEQLSVIHSGIPSVAVEVALSLLERSGNEAEELSVPVGASVEVDFPNDASTTMAGTGADLVQRECAGASALSSRASTVDIADWLRQALVRLPSFPDCRPPPSAKDLYVMRAADGVVQFNIDNVFNAVQQENIRIHRVPLSMQEARDKLQPYIEANYCFLMYASAVNFVEGWCEVVSLSFTVVRGLSEARSRAFVQHILSGAAASMNMTRAAQEQVAFRLFSCVSTLMVHLKQHVEQHARLEYQKAGRPGDVSATGAALFSTAGARAAGAVVARNSAFGATGVVDMSRGGPQSTLMSATGDATTNTTRQASRYLNTDASLAGGHRAAGHRRARDVPNAVSVSNTSVFSTVAGTRYSQLNASGRAAVVAQKQDQQRRAWQRRDRLERLGAWSLDDTWAAIGEDNQCLVRPLISAVVEWGTRVPGVRVDLYTSLLCLSLIPGVTAEEMMVRRQQDALFALLASDIVGANVEHGRRSAALELLIQLLQVSPTLRAGFVAPAGSAFLDAMTPALGHTAEQCAVALLKRVDDGVYDFLTKGGEALGGLLWLIRGTFDFLSVLSQDSVSSVLGSTVFDLCLNLRSWSQSSQVVLGHTGQSDLLQARTMPLEANKEVLMRLLLAAVRWFNLLLSQAADSPRLLGALLQFVGLYRHLIEYALNSPLAQAHARPLTTVAITLYAEITCMLEWLSASPLVTECRVFVPALALTRLLATMANTQFLNGHWFTSEYASSSASLVDTAASSAGVAAQQGSAVRSRGGAGPATPTQRDLVLLTVRNIAHLLVRTELGPLNVICLQPHASSLLNSFVSAQATTGGAMYKPIRAQPVEMESVAESLSTLAELTTHIATNAASAIATTSVTLEALLLALHALVCLCHSFVLPGGEGGECEAEVSASQPAGGVSRPGFSPPAASTVAARAYKPDPHLSFEAHLQTVPVAALLRTLRRVQQAVYALSLLNADYRTGVYSRQTSNGFTITTDSLSNQLTARAGDRLASIVSPLSVSKAITGPLRADDPHRSGSHPTTPLSAPVGAGGSGKGRVTAGGPSHCQTTPGTPHISLQAGRGGNSRLLAESGAEADSRRPHTAPPRKSLHFGDDEEPKAGLPTRRTTTFGDQIGDATMAPPTDVTIGDLLEQSGPDDTTATGYVGFPQSASGASRAPGGEHEDPDAFVYAGAADWDAILGLEHTARQLKIGIANAIAATEDAAKSLGLSIAAV